VRERERERERETEEKEGVVICFRGLVKFLLWKISLLLITYILVNAIEISRFISIK